MQRVVSDKPYKREVRPASAAPVSSKYDVLNTLNTMREKRIAAGLSQQALGDLLNVPRTYISLWENGEIRPQFDNLVRLYRVLHGIVTE